MIWDRHNSYIMDEDGLVHERLSRKAGSGGQKEPKRNGRLHRGTLQFQAGQTVISSGSDRRRKRSSPD